MSLTRCLLVQRGALGKRALSMHQSKRAPSRAATLDRRQAAAKLRQESESSSSMLIKTSEDSGGAAEEKPDDKAASAGVDNSTDRFAGEPASSPDPIAAPVSVKTAVDIAAEKQEEIRQRVKSVAAPQNRMSMSLTAELNGMLGRGRGRGRGGPGGIGSMGAVMAVNFALP